MNRIIEYLFCDWTSLEFVLIISPCHYKTDSFNGRWTKKFNISAIDYSLYENYARKGYEMLNHFYIAKKAPDLNFDLGFELDEPNRRKEPRTPCLIPAHYKINRQIYSSFILDINDTGAFIETDRSFPTGDKVVLKFLDPYSRRSSLINGSIAWSSDAAIGVKFNYHLFTPF